MRILISNDDGYKVSDAFDEVYLGEAMGYHHGTDPLPKADPSDPTIIKTVRGLGYRVD